MQSVPRPNFDASTPWGSASVRTRNALHEVGAALTRDEHEARSSTGVERQRELREPQPHISHFLIIFNYFIILYFTFYIDINHTLRISIKTSKTRVNSTRFEAIYSRFRVLGALFNNKSFYKLFNVFNYFIIFLITLFSNIY